MMMRRAACAVAALTVIATGWTHAAGARPRFFGGVVRDLRSGARPRAAAHAANLPYHGGPVLHSNRTHLIFWAPAGSDLTFEPGYQSLIEGFLANVAAASRWPTNVYGLSGQYRDATGPAAYKSTYGGAVTATDPLPPNGCTEPPPPPAGSGPGWHVCLNSAQLEEEVVHVLDDDGLPQTTHDIYFLVMPNGLGSCEFSGPTECALGGDADQGYCAYHANTADEVPYAVIPYNAVPAHCQSSNPRPNSSTADPTISVISHEHNEAVTDPLGTAWIDSNAQEDGDLCITNFGDDIGGSGAGAWNEAIHGGHYYLQEEWSNANSSCRPRAQGDSVSFSAPRRGLLGQKISFAAHVGKMEAPIKSFDWFFGDHRRGHHRRVSHRYGRAGGFRVVLRTTDGWGNWAFYARRIAVATS